MADSRDIFPATKQEALAMLFVESQDLTGKTPEQIAEMYADAYTRIREKLRSIRQDRLV